MLRVFDPEPMIRGLSARSKPFFCHRYTSGSVPVDCDGSQKFDIVPDACYHIGQVLVDGNAIMTPPSGSFSIEFQHVQSNRTISASFALTNYTITAALPTSRPILERLGFVRLTETWPCMWRPEPASPAPR